MNRQSAGGQVSDGRLRRVLAPGGVCIAVTNGESRRRRILA